MKLPLKYKTFSLVDKTIEVELRKEIPDNLFKYFSVNQYSVQNLVENKIHFSHPFKLNDIMEGSSQLWDLNDFIKQYSEETKKDPFEAFNIITKYFPEDVFKHRGILCLTENFDNNLFWPHYTSELGFCIEFITSELLKSMDGEKFIIFPIDYEKLQPINFNDYILREDSENKAGINAQLPLTYAMAVKDEIWAYEKEWRIVLEKEDLGKVSHPLNIISDEDYFAELEGLINRNISYQRKSLNRVILSTLFFSNSRFVKKEKVNNEVTHYYFRKVDNDLFEFFLELYQNYNDKIYQIDRDVVSGTVVSKLNYKISILYLNKKYITIQSERIV